MGQKTHGARAAGSAGVRGTMRHARRCSRSGRLDRRAVAVPGEVDAGRAASTQSDVERRRAWPATATYAVVDARDGQGRQREASAAVGRVARVPGPLRRRADRGRAAPARRDHAARRERDRQRRSAMSTSASPRCSADRCSSRRSRPKATATSRCGPRSTASCRTTSASRTRVEGDEADGTLTDLSLALAAAPGTFFDVSALHVVTTATLEHLGELAPESRFAVERYRPNIVIDADGRAVRRERLERRGICISAPTLTRVGAASRRCAAS